MSSSMPAASSFIADDSAMRARVMFDADATLCYAHMLMIRARYMAEKKRAASLRHVTTMRASIRRHGCHITPLLAAAAMLILLHAATC